MVKLKERETVQNNISRRLRLLAGIRTGLGSGLGSGLRRGLRKYSASTAAAVGVAGLAAGCGLLDLDSFRGVTFDMPEQTYNIDTKDQRWDKPPEGAVPNIPCGPGAVTVTCCDVPPPLSQSLSINCERYPLVCEDNACAYRFTYEVDSLVDLKKQVPQLNSSAGDALSDILLKNIKVTLNNGLNTALPPVEVFVAPMDATTASDARARKVVVLPGRQAGYAGSETIPVDAAGQAAFSQFATDYQKPFKIIARTQIVIRAGQPAPEGKAVTKVGGQVEAKI